jgi:hypothetical protein
MLFIMLTGRTDEKIVFFNALIIETELGDGRKVALRNN